MVLMCVGGVGVDVVEVVVGGVVFVGAVGTGGRVVVVVYVRLLVVSLCCVYRCCSGVECRYAGMSYVG